MTKIAQALAALIRASRANSFSVCETPETGCVSISISHETDEDALATAAEFGITLEPTGNLTHTWMRGSTRLGDDIYVTMYGPHRERVAATASDEATVESALALAEEAVSQ